MSNKKLILASKSPRRKEFFDWLGIPYEIKTVHIEEKSEKESVDEIVKDLAYQKGSAVLAQETSHHVIVSADTIVALDNIIFGKPNNEQQAKEFLLKLQNKTHQVISAVYIGTKEQEHVFSCSTNVTFGELPQSLLESYIASKDSLDKAGAYGIQGMAQSFITNIEGSYSNVVGFPMAQFISAMADFYHNKDWRSNFL